MCLTSDLSSTSSQNNGSLAAIVAAAQGRFLLAAAPPELMEQNERQEVDERDVCGEKTSAARPSGPRAEPAFALGGRKTSSVLKGWRPADCDDLDLRERLNRLPGHPVTAVIDPWKGRGGGEALLSDTRHPHTFISEGFLQTDSLTAFPAAWLRLERFNAAKTTNRQSEQRRFWLSTNRLITNRRALLFYSPELIRTSLQYLMVDSSSLTAFRTLAVEPPAR